MGERIDLTIPVRADLVVLARLAAATVAGRAGFGVEDIEDLRLAVDELCVSVVRHHDDGRLALSYAYEGDAIEISCTLLSDTEPTGGSRPDGSAEDGFDDLSSRILDALVDEHGRASTGRRNAWLKKRGNSGMADGERSSAN